MLLEVNEAQRFNLIEETKITTECGALYQAQDLNLERTVAVKLVNISGSSLRDRETNYFKALSEVKAMVCIGEEYVNIPKIFLTYYDRKKSVFYIVMEWIKGQNLDAYMGCSEREFLNWMIDLCRILEVMERKKIYHKDIKPENILITPNRTLYLIDFNISISAANLVEGTSEYRAPEMRADSRYAGREKVDMFAIGVLMYRYYTSILPTRGRDYSRNRQRGPMEWDEFVEPKTRNPEMSDGANDIIVKCMKLDPKQRYNRISELRNDLIKVVRNLNGARRKN